MTEATSRLTNWSDPMERGYRCDLAFIMAGLAMAIGVAQTRAEERLVFISAFAAGKEGAIHAYHLDLDSGTLKLAQRTTDVEHPFFLALAPNQKFLYSIHAKQFGGKEPEQVAAYEIVGRTGQLK